MKRRGIPKNMDEAALDAALQAALYRRDCPTTMELGDSHMGLLTEDKHARIQSHVQRCPHCQAELSRLTNLRVDASAAFPEPDPSWIQQALDYGRVWLDAQTGRWRQLRLSLSSLTSGPAGAPALAGLMGAESSASMPGTLYVVGPNAVVEIRIRVVPEPTPTDPNLCRLEVDLTLKDRFGDFSGVEVTLLRDRAAYAQYTNAQGEVAFSGLPSDQLATMSLIVILPE